ncbi:SDR family NAD(P)-dependent oxidoreductase [Halieaceae bacterium IMCC14734]|uniref:SDR family NAD(P)-dependent oxidoreductase n=1 Tax=Candidatus Litorirhabdus singularis TaxID=2518993 RepID=A0ABT3TFZ0_9GAMM|nr:SDR family NAD(P)-dependent oxidoreductase [Candidatus Litorirhabdus singularis]MCX2980339.1 SDR family NAD(P)-dependent oxidoreductase [Candidatus Litorirhabdus singularis]
MEHPAFAENNVAVITGAADGIGLAAAKKYAGMGMRVCMADINLAKLEAATATIPGALAVATDVSDIAQVEALRDSAYAAFGQVDVLMNNAGMGASTGCWTERDNWLRVLQVNLWGVINGTQAFSAAMLAQATPGVIINTGSKQGITCPPGNPAYNVSKAGIKTFTEALQHELRNTADCQISAHLLVPGFTYTGMIASFMPEQPPAAWSPAQVVDFLLQGVNAGDFYILCPDNDVDRAADNKRMAWAVGDLIHNRPPLSRWHPDFAQAFESYQLDPQTSANDD